MAKKITIDIEVNGKMEKATLSTKKLRKALDDTADSQSKVQKQTRNTERNMQGLSKRTSNTTKEFSKMQQGVGGLVGVYATIAAQVFAVSAAFQFLKGASDVANLIESQKQLGAVSGVAYQTLTAGLREATEGQLSFAEASRAAAIGTAGGLNSTQLEGLAKAAKNASTALGRDLTDSFNRLIRGTTKAEPELLDELGIVLRLETAMENYKLKMGLVGQELTAFQRTQAVANEVLTQANTKFGLLEKNLDPGTFALNQFINSFDELINSFRVGVIDTLRPVFVFLSKNTTALTAALTLFALPVVKSIIPNLQDWRKNAQATYKDQTESLKNLNKVQNQYVLDLERLSIKEKDRAKAATELAEATKKGGKADASREGGLAFLQGKESAQTEKGRKAAEQILLTAEKQLEDSAKRRTGALAHMNAQQVADARKSYAIRAGLLKGQEIREITMYEKVGRKSQIFYMSVQKMATRTARVVSAASIAMSKALNFAMMATGIIGIISLLGSLAFAAKDFLFPISEERRRLEEDIEATVDKMSTLNDELARMVDALSTPGMALGQSVSLLGNAVTSMDLATNLPKMLKMKEKMEELGMPTKEIGEQINNLAVSAFLLDKELGLLAISFIKGGDGALGFMSARAAELESAGVAEDSLAEAIQRRQQIQEGMRAKEASQLTDLKRAMVEEAKLSEEASGAKLKRLEELGAMQKKAEDERDTAVQNLLDLEKEAAEIPLRVDESDLQAARDAVKLAKEQVEAHKDGVTTARQEAAVIEEQNELRQKLARVINETETKAIKDRTEALDLEEEAFKLKNAGVDAAGKNNNLLSAEKRARAQVLNLGADLAEAEAMLLIAKEDQSEAGKEEIANQQIVVDVLKNKLGISEKQLDILMATSPFQRELNKLQESQTVLNNKAKLLSMEKSLNTELDRERQLRQQIFDLEIQQQKDAINLEAQRRGTANPFFDEEQFKRRELLQLEKDNLVANQNRINEDYALKVKQINLEYDLLDAKKEQSALELEVLANAVRQRKKLAADGSQDDSEVKALTDMADRFRGINYAPAKEAALALAKATKDAEETKLEGIVEGMELAIEAAEGFNMVLGDAADAFRGGLSDAIGATLDVITGKTSSLKDALAGIASSVIGQIQQSFIDNMIVRPIMENFGGQDEPFDSKKAQSNIKQGHVDGSTEVKTAITSAGDELKRKIEEGGTAAAQAMQQSGCINLCKSESPDPSHPDPMTTAGGELPASVTDPAAHLNTPEKAVDPNALPKVQQDLIGGKFGTDETGAIVSNDEKKGGGFTKALDGVKGALTENIGATGMLIGTLFGNTKIGQKIQKVSAALLAIDMVMKILAKLGLVSEKANTTALIALTAATIKAAATNIIPGTGRTGIYPPMGYAVGGIAKGSERGYPAILHGTEAVVPLPNGKEIPVAMKGPSMAGQQNNVTVNVSVDNEGKARSDTQSDSQDAAQLGNAVALAVQKELQNQKRSGGILSPHGVA